MNPRSKKLAGILLIILPTVAYGGVTLLAFLINRESGYVDNPLRQDLWRAGHAHAGVLLILSLVILKYVDDTNLPSTLKQFARIGTPLTAIIIPAAFFLSVLDPESKEPNNLIYLAFGGFALLTFTLVTIGVGLVRKEQMPDNHFSSRSEH